MAAGEVGEGKLGFWWFCRGWERKVLRRSGGWDQGGLATGTERRREGEGEWGGEALGEEEAERSWIQEEGGEDTWSRRWI